MVVRAQQSEALFDNVLFVTLGHVDFAHFDELDHPARIQVHHEANAAAVLGQVLDRQPQAARAARAEHQPVGAARESVIGERGAEGFVIQAEVLYG